MPRYGSKEIRTSISGCLTDEEEYMQLQLDKTHWIGWDASTAVLAQSREAAAPLGFQFAYCNFSANKEGTEDAYPHRV
jgi:hypothetical protein